MEEGGGGADGSNPLLLQERREAAEEEEKRRKEKGDRPDVLHLVPPHIPNLQGGYLPGTTPHSVDGLREIAKKHGVDEDEFMFRSASQLRPALGANAGGATAEQAKPLLGRVVYAGWPFLAPAICVGLCDGKQELTFEGAGRAPRSRKLSHAEMVRFMSESADKAEVLLTGSESNLLARCGVWAGDVQLVVTVRRLVGMKRNPRTGSLTRDFAAAGSDGELKEAAQLVFVGHPSPDDAFAEADGKALEVRLPIGSTVSLLRPVQITTAALGPKEHPQLEMVQAGLRQLAPGRFAGAQAVVVGYSPVQEELSEGETVPRSGLDLAIVGGCNAEPEFGGRLVQQFSEPYYGV